MPPVAELQGLYAEYASALDDRRYADWVGLFTPDCIYRIQPRENHDRGLPLCTLAFEGQGMLKDRIYGIEQTLFHSPYYQRHVIGPLRIRAADQAGSAPATGSAASAGERYQVQANYSVFRTKANERTEVFNVGRYIDEVVRDAGGLKFASKLVVFDSEMIPNSIIYPL